MFREPFANLPPRTVAIVVLALSVVAGVHGSARAHETDAFSTPAPDARGLAPEFVDLGPTLDAWMYRALKAAVERVNAPLRPLARDGNDPLRLAMLQRPDEVVKAVNASLPRSLELIDALERLARSRQSEARFAGKITAYRPGGAGVYRNAFRGPDLRAIAHNMLSSTILVHGVYQGTDKLGHFTDVGVGYYWRYRKALQAGADDATAIAAAVRSGTEGTFSESGLLGLAGTGSYGNADLAANFAGLLFYRNLTEPVRVNGRTRPAMFVRAGPYWRLADHVSPSAPLLKPFVTDHWDEALNPCLLDRAMRPAVRRAVRARATGVMRRYADEDGNPRPYAYFARRQFELGTYDGVDYGHAGGPAELIGAAEASLALDPPAAFVDATSHLAHAHR